MRFLHPNAVLLVLLALAPSAAQGGVIEVRPTTLTITPAQHIATLSLVNPETRPGIFQVRIYSWHQKGDEQVLEPTDEVIASPPMVSLDSHGSQTVRVGLRGEVPDSEKTYRLILEEIPQSNIPDQQGLNISLRISLPLFVRPQLTLPPAQLDAEMRISGSKAHLVIHNNGRFTTRLTQASFSTPGANATSKDKADKLQADRLAYVLPGNWVSFDFNLPVQPVSFHDVTVTVQTDDGPLDLKAPVVAEVTSDVPVPLEH